MPSLLVVTMLPVSRKSSVASVLLDWALCTVDEEDIEDVVLNGSPGTWVWTSGGKSGGEPPLETTTGGRGGDEVGEEGGPPMFSVKREERKPGVCPHSR